MLYAYHRHAAELRAPTGILYKTTRWLDVLHRSWTMLMLDKKTIAVILSLRSGTYPWATSLLIVPTKQRRFVSCNSWCCFCFRHPRALSRMKITSLKTYPYTQSASTERPSVEAPWPSNSHSWPANWLTLSCLWLLLLTMAQGGWNLDIETRCMQEVCWCRGSSDIATTKT